MCTLRRSGADSLANSQSSRKDLSGCEPAPLRAASSSPPVLSDPQSSRAARAAVRSERAALLEDPGTIYGGLDTRAPASTRRIDLDQPAAPYSLSSARRPIRSNRALPPHDHRTTSRGLARNAQHSHRQPSAGLHQIEWIANSELGARTRARRRLFR